MLADPKLLDLMKWRELEDDTDFTLPEHFRERYEFHLKMLMHYAEELDRLREG